MNALLISIQTPSYSALQTWQQPTFLEFNHVFSLLADAQKVVDKFIRLLVSSTDFQAKDLFTFSEALNKD